MALNRSLNSSILARGNRHSLNLLATPPRRSQAYHIPISRFLGQTLQQTLRMSFSTLVKFESTGDNKVYYADLGASSKAVPNQGTKIDGYESIDDLVSTKGGKAVSVEKVSKPGARLAY